SVRSAFYRESLNDATNANTVAEKWDQNTNCVFAQDGYNEEEASNWHICAEGAYTYQDMTITVNVQIVNGLTGGLMFRASPATTGHDQYSGYLFQINDVGQYQISCISSSLGSICNSSIFSLEILTISTSLQTFSSLLIY